MIDVAIVGGGIIGLSIAREAINLGLDVSVFDRPEPASASGRAAGMLAPLSEAREVEPELLKISKESLLRWPDFANSLERETGLVVDFRQNGILHAAVDADHHRAHQHLKSQLVSLGLRARDLDADEVLEMEPYLSPRIFSGLFCEDECSVDPESVVKALRQTVGENLKSADVTEVTDAGVRLSQGEQVDAKIVIVASGAWATKLAGIEAPRLRPIRGQVVHVSTDVPLCDRPIRTPDVYLVPRADGGRTIIGATMEEVGFDPSQTFGGIMELMQDAWETMPGLYDARLVSTCSGFRPVAYNNLPTVGPVDPERPHVLFAVGHGRGGILLTPWTVKKIITEIEKLV